MVKIYEAKSSCDGYLPHDALILLGAFPARDQGTWYIVANTGVEAVEHAHAARIPHVSGPRALRVWGKSVHAEALKVRGYLTVPGEVIAHLPHRSKTNVLRAVNGIWSIIGRFEYDERAHRDVFIPEEN